MLQLLQITKKISLGNGLVTIGDNSFRDCEMIESIDIGDSFIHFCDEETQRFGMHYRYGQDGLTSGAGHHLDRAFGYGRHKEV
jgi:hypothetical protein